MDKGLIIC